MDQHASEKSLDRTLARLVCTLSRLEEQLPYVTARLLQAQLAQSGVSRTELSRTEDLLAQAVERGLVFTDARTIFEPDSRTFVPASIYRLNHRHPFVRNVLESCS